MDKLTEQQFVMLCRWQKAALEFDIIGSWSMAEYCRFQVIKILRGEL